MNKLAFQILTTVVSQPGITRKELVAQVQSKHPVAAHDIIVEMTELKSIGLLVETDQNLSPVPEKADYYQTMHPFTDDETLALMIKHMNGPGGTPTTITHLNSYLQLHLDNEDREYFEALLKTNKFIRTTYPSGPTIATFFISDDGKIELRKYGGYLEYLDAQKPKRKLEDLVLEYLNERDIMWIETREVFKDCGIEFRHIRTTLALLGNRINRLPSKNDDLPEAIKISDEGRRYLHGYASPPTPSINVVHNDNSTHTHGDNSPVVHGNFTSEVHSSNKVEVPSPTGESPVKKKIPWGNIWAAIGVLVALAVFAYGFFKK